MPAGLGLPPAAGRRSRSSLAAAGSFGAARSRKLMTDPDLSVLRRPQPAEGETVYVEDLGLGAHPRQPLRQMNSALMDAAEEAADDALLDAEVSAIQLRSLSILKVSCAPIAARRPPAPRPPPPLSPPHELTLMLPPPRTRRCPTRGSSRASRGPSHTSSWQTSGRTPSAARPRPAECRSARARATRTPISGGIGQQRARKCLRSQRAGEEQCHDKRR